jgi:hypothetical protein
MSIMDFLDDFVFGPLNLINRVEGLIKLAIYHDRGVRLAIPREDKGGKHSLPEVRALLRKYGVDSFGCTHDARNLYFSVKQRQAAWAEYLLLHAGIALLSPPVDPRNAKYVAQHSPGWLPPSWEDGDHMDQPKSNNSHESTDSFWQKLDRSLDEFLK